MITKEGDSYKIVPPQAFVYNPMNLRFGALAANHNDFKVSVSGYYDVFYMGNKNTLTFWENYLTTPKMLHYYFTIATGSLIEKLRVHFTQFVKIEKKVPCIDEQQKIADFLSLVDKRIDKQRQLVENLKKYKRGLLSAIFERNIKFSNEEWLTFKIKDLGSFYNGLSGKNKDDFGVGNDEFITYMNVYKNTIAEDEMCEKVFIDNNEKQNKVEYGDILFTQSSETLEEVGFSSVWLCNKSPYLNSFCFGFKLIDKSKISPLFLAYYLRSNLVRRLIMREGQGVTRVNLSAERLKDIPIKIPSITEQNKIANFIFEYDKKINTEEAILKKIELTKKSLLQQMFI